MTRGWFADFNFTQNSAAVLNTISDDVRFSAASAVRVVGIVVAKDRRRMRLVQLLKKASS